MTVRDLMLIALVVLFGAFGLLLWGIRRDLDLAVFRVRDGRVTLVRGRPPPELLAEVEDVLRDTPKVTVRVVLEGARPTVRTRGKISPDHVQRLRNVVGRFRKAQFPPVGRGSARRFR